MYKEREREGERRGGKCIKGGGKERQEKKGREKGGMENGERAEERGVGEGENKWKGER